MEDYGDLRAKSMRKRKWDKLEEYFLKLFN